jgi:tetratricopeptide (TPR) repeat protein
MSRSQKIQEKRKKHKRAATLLAAGADNNNNEVAVDQVPNVQEEVASVVEMQPSVPSEPFVACLSFAGRKEGWYFTKGRLGLGYYQDTPENRAQNLSTGINLGGGRGAEDQGDSSDDEYDEETNPFMLSSGGDEQQMHANMKLKMTGETVERVLRNDSLMQTGEFVDLIMMYHESLESALILHDPQDRLPLAIHSIESLEALLPKNDLGLIPFISAMGHSYLLLDDLEEALHCTLRCVVMLVRLEGQCHPDLIKPFVILLYSLSNWFVLQAMEAEDYLSFGTSENFIDVQAVVETTDLSIAALEADDVRAVFAIIDAGESLFELEAFEDSGKVAFSCFSCSWHMYTAQSHCVGIEGGWSGLSGASNALTSALQHASQATTVDQFSAIARAYQALARMAQASGQVKVELENNTSTDLQNPRPIYSESLINQFCEDCAQSEQLGLGDTGVEMSGFHARVQRYMRAWGMQMALTVSPPPTRSAEYEPSSLHKQSWRPPFFTATASSSFSPTNTFSPTTKEIMAQRPSLPSDEFAITRYFFLYGGYEADHTKRNATMTDLTLDLETAQLELKGCKESSAKKNCKLTILMIEGRLSLLRREFRTAYSSFTEAILMIVHSFSENNDKTGSSDKPGGSDKHGRKSSTSEKPPAAATEEQMSLLSIDRETESFLYEIYGGFLFMCRHYRQSHVALTRAIQKNPHNITARLKRAAFAIELHGLYPVSNALQDVKISMEIAEIATTAKIATAAFREAADGGGNGATAKNDAAESFLSLMMMGLTSVRPRIHMIAGMLHFFNENPLDAVEHFQMSCELSVGQPVHRSCCALFGLMQAQIGQGQEGLKYLTNALYIPPNSVAHSKALDNISFILLDVIEICLPALTYFPFLREQVDIVFDFLSGNDMKKLTIENPSALVLRGLCCESADQSIACFQSALKVDPQNAKAHAALFKRLTASAPEDATHHFHCALQNCSRLPSSSLADMLSFAKLIQHTNKEEYAHDQNLFNFNINKIHAAKEKAPAAADVHLQRASSLEVLLPPPLIPSLPLCAFLILQVKEKEKERGEGGGGGGGGGSLIDGGRE